MLYSNMQQQNPVRDRKNPIRLSLRGFFCLSLRGAKRRGNLLHWRLPRRFAPRNDKQKKSLLAVSGQQ